MNKKAYDAIAPRWHEHRAKAPLNRCVAEFAAGIRPGGSILDIGCGTGYPIAKYLCDQGFSVTGIDISKNMLAEAEKLQLPNARFYLQDFFEYRPAEKFDAIIAFDSFFHFPRQRQAEIYARVSSWMKVGAHILFTHGSIDGELEDCMYGERFYYSALATKKVHELLAESGLCIATSIEGYKEATTGERDLMIVAKKIS